MAVGCFALILLGQRHNPTETEGYVLYKIYLSTLNQSRLYQCSAACLQQGSLKMNWCHNHNDTHFLSVSNTGNFTEIIPIFGGNFQNE